MANNALAGERKYREELLESGSWTQGRKVRRRSERWRLKRVVTEREATGGLGSTEAEGAWPEVKGRSRPLEENQYAERTEVGTGRLVCPVWMFKSQGHVPRCVHSLLL